MGKISAGFIGAIACAIALPAGAALVTTPTQTIPFGGITDFTQIKTFMLFDSNLGTLKSLTVSDSYGITSDVKFTNNAASASSGWVQTDSTFDLSAADANQNAVLTGLLKQLDVLSAKITYNLTPGQTTTGSSTPPSESNPTISDTTAADLAYFAVAGGGTASITGKSSTSTTQSNTGGNTTSSQVTNATGFFSIYYTYDDSTSVAVLPEPATWGMMILGFGMIGAAARRRRAVVAFSR